MKRETAIKNKYYDFIRKSPTIHVVYESINMIAYTINEKITFQTESEFKSWKKDSLFTDNQIKIKDI